MPLRYVRPPEPMERDALTRQLKTNTEGWPVPKIAALLQVHGRLVRELAGSGIMRTRCVLARECVRRR